MTSTLIPAMHLERSGAIVHYAREMPCLAFILSLRSSPLENNIAFKRPRRSLQAARRISRVGCWECWPACFVLNPLENNIALKQPRRLLQAARRASRAGGQRLSASALCSGEQWPIANRRCLSLFSTASLEKAA